MEIGGHKIAAIKTPMAALDEGILFCDTFDNMMEQVGFEYDVLSLYIAKDRPDSDPECINFLRATQEHIEKRFKILKRLKDICDKYQKGVTKLIKRQKDLDELYEQHGLKE